MAQAAHGEFVGYVGAEPGQEQDPEPVPLQGNGGLVGQQYAMQGDQEGEHDEHAAQLVGVEHGGRMAADQALVEHPR